ncbi:MAG: TlpA family protein disulfide reductase [Phycisphaerales bacterium]|nr:MAG: TlpA family protein disulfide reductase [Phycisphaerales bacterium]
MNIVVCITAVLSAAPVQSPPSLPIQYGPWRGWLDSPGGPLPFRLDFHPRGEGLAGFVTNSRERLAIPQVRTEGDEVILDFDHYDSRIRARASEGGMRLDGEWTRRRGADEWTRMAFHATYGAQPLFDLTHGAAEEAGILSLKGRWEVKFDSSETPAVAEFVAFEQGWAFGTLMTTGGDYRYLGGEFDGQRLRLSSFDGAHAFLFHADKQVNGTLKGTFWSASHWKEGWTARLNKEAKLPDPFGLTRWTGKAALEELRFPDLEGKEHSLADPAFAGKARIIELFGSWCPNCHDAAGLLAELEKKYGPRGLRILGLAFEATGDFERDARLVRIYTSKHNVSYPVLIAGVKDRDKASAAFPLLDQIRAYPTFIFMDGDGVVRSVYTGFSGPATADAYKKLRGEFESVIEEMLGE